MVKYSCETCHKIFTQKGNFEKHMSRKRPCKKDNTIEVLVEQKVKEVLSETNMLNESSTDQEMKSSQMDYTKKTREELITICKEKKIKGYSGKKKDEIIKLLKLLKPTPPNESNNVTEEYKNVINKPSKSVIEYITEKLNVIDLFCGCGGMSKGLTDAGLNIIAGIDIWDKAVESYNKNFEHNAYCEDLTKLSPEKFNELYNKENKNIDILVGGPPCQSFSIAGKRDKNDPRNALFMEYVKYLDYFKPKAFIMENVIGMLSKKTSNGEKVIDIIMEQLDRNYNCIINKLYASDFEVPQNRRRAIIIGIRKDLNII